MCYSFIKKNHFFAFFAFFLPRGGRRTLFFGAFFSIFCAVFSAFQAFSQDMDGDLALQLFIRSTSEKEWEETLPYVLVEAQKGNPQAVHLLGYAYFTGRGVDRDLEQAEHWYREALAAGYIYSEVHLGVLAASSNGKDPDYEGAREFLQHAYKVEGWPEAARELARLEYYGLGGERNPERAAKLYEEAARGGDRIAQANIGLLYANGDGVPASPARAAFFLRQSAEQGDAYSQYGLADCYLRGFGVPANPPMGWVWMDRAAQQGHQLAMRELARAYFRGEEGVAKNPALALPWMVKLAEAGDVEAMLAAGLMYAGENGFAANDREAAHWLHQAAKRGRVEAQYILGTFFEQGRAIAKDLKEAARWYEKAARQEHAEAQLALARLEHGVAEREHTDATFANAYAWALLAEQGNAEGASEYVQQMTDALSPADVVAGRARAEKIQQEILAAQRSSMSPLPLEVEAPADATAGHPAGGGGTEWAPPVEIIAPKE